MNQEQLMTKTNTFKTSIFKEWRFKTKNISLIVIISIAIYFNFIAKVNATEQKKLILNNERSTALITHSLGQSKTKTSHVIKTKMSKNVLNTVGKTRTVHLILKQSTLHKVSIQSPNNNEEINISVDNQTVNLNSFSMYRVFSYLLEDVDGDEFYQSFSIVFDVDIYHSAYAEVYAELYLRKDNGPWIHYYSTDVFALYGESEDDEFEVNTILEQGFTDGFYDVLIDLYEANSDELVVSYSSDDSNALYALTLESSEYDQIYTTDVEVIYSNGGSTSLFGLLTAFILVIYRYKQISL